MAYVFLRENRVCKFVLRQRLYEICYGSFVYIIGDFSRTNRPNSECVATVVSPGILLGSW